MIRWLARRRLDAFDRDFGYDSSYARAILDADPAAFVLFAKVMGLSGYRRDIPADAYAAASLVGVVAEDCGPCTQLGVTMARRAGVPDETLRAILEGDEAAMPADAALAYRFARATLAHDVEAEGLREAIVRKWGRKGLISLAFGLTAARMYPTIKYALGHGQACARIRVGGQVVSVARPQAVG